MFVCILAYLFSYFPSSIHSSPSPLGSERMLALSITSLRGTLQAGDGWSLMSLSPQEPQKAVHHGFRSFLRRVLVMMSGRRLMTMTNGSLQRWLRVLAA